jgi:hypothetical protein
MTVADKSKFTFIIPGFRMDGATRGAAGAPMAPPLGLRGVVKASVRVGSVRAGGEAQRVEAVAGRDVVVLRVANGPALVLHPESARDLLAAQTGETRGAALGIDHESNIIDVPTQLRWRGLESAAPVSRGDVRGGLGDALLEGFDVVSDHVKGKAQDYVASELAKRIDGQVVEGVYKLRPETLTSLKGEPVLATLPDANGAPTLVFVHGTFSSTSSGFSQLWTKHPQRVRLLFQHYGNRVFTLDHQTLSVSPIENALTLVKACPKGTLLHLVTHSRGGLVAWRAPEPCANSAPTISTRSTTPVMRSRKRLSQIWWR